MQSISLRVTAGSSLTLFCAPLDHVLLLEVFGVDVSEVVNLTPPMATLSSQRFNFFSYQGLKKT